MRILNLYAGIGGNRKLWGNDHQITAVEHNFEIAGIYKDLFPKDNVIVCDAHKYLLENYKRFDIIWTSPPCQTHSQIRQNLGVKCKNTMPVYPDVTLWQEIIFLKYNFKGKFIVENVNPYYPIFNTEIKPQLIGRHFFWTNFKIPNKRFGKSGIRCSNIQSLQKRLNINIDKYNIKNKRQILRNCVDPKLGLHILLSTLKIYPTINEWITQN